MGITLYHADPTTGEVFETIEVHTDAEKEFRMRPEGGLWYETPRWHRNPKPHGGDPSNPYERVNPIGYIEFPRILYKKTEQRDPETKQPFWKTLTVKDEKEKQIALKNGYCLVPNEKQHAELMGLTATPV